MGVGEASRRQWLIALLRSPLESDYGSVRFAALVHLGKLGAPEAIPHIVPFLGHSDFATRASAVVALTCLDARDAAGHVVRALDDDHAGVRQRAAEGLGVLGHGDELAVSGLVHALDDDVWHVRRCALKSLSTLGDATAVPAIEAYARRERLWRRHYAIRARRILRRSQSER